VQVIEFSQQSPGFGLHLARALCAIHGHDGPVARRGERHLNLIRILAVIRDRRANAQHRSKALAKA